MLSSSVRLGIAHIGHMPLAACQPPDQKRIDRPKEDLTPLGSRL